MELELEFSEGDFSVVLEAAEDNPNKEKNGNWNVYPIVNHTPDKKHPKVEGTNYNYALKIYYSKVQIYKYRKSYHKKKN